MQNASNNMKGDTSGERLHIQGRERVAKK